MRVPCKHGARDFGSFGKRNRPIRSKKIFIFSSRALVAARCAGLKFYRVFVVKLESLKSTLHPFCTPRFGVRRDSISVKNL